MLILASRSQETGCPVADEIANGGLKVGIPHGIDRLKRVTMRTVWSGCTS
jgi:hypothetical protein